MTLAAACSTLCAALLAILTRLSVFSRSARHGGERQRSLVRSMHELRGALTALRLGISLIDRCVLSQSELGARIEGLQAQVERAELAVIELDASRRGEAPTALSRADQSVDLASMVLRRARAWSQLAPGYEASLELNWRAGAAYVRGDPDRLRQAIDNLLGNALEHGGGRVLLEGTRVGKAVRVAISDGGAGLPCPPHELAEAPPSSPRGHGLAIARDAIEALGGRLTSQRAPNRSTLVLELPVARPSAGASAREPWDVDSDPSVPIGSSAPRAA
jgi:signal transduction histidine kinase